MPLTAATANVLTLLPFQQARAYAAVSGICMRSKVTMLEMQFHQHGLDIVGIQEGRSPQAELTEGQHYTMVSAAADAHGALGVQLWVKHSLPIVAWQAESPRLLHAVVGKRGYEVGCLVAHAPHSMSAEPDRLQWWADLDRLAGKIFARFRIPWFVLIDANGRVGSTPSHVLGPSYAETENPNGCSLRVFAEDHGLALNNTWGTSGPTWTSTFGTRARIDYVLSTAELSHRRRWCEPLPSIDLTLNAKQDHDLVAMETLVCYGTPMSTPPTTFRVN